MWNPNAGGGQGYPYGTQCWPRHEGAPGSASFVNNTGIPGMHPQQQMFGAMADQMHMAHTMAQPTMGVPLIVAGWTHLAPRMQPPRMQPPGMPQGPAPSMQQHIPPVSPHTPVPNLSPYPQFERAPVHNPHQYGPNTGASHAGAMYNQSVGVRMEQPHHLGAERQVATEPFIQPKTDTLNHMQPQSSSTSFTPGQQPYKPHVESTSNANVPPVTNQLPDISNEVSRKFDEIISGNKPISRVVVDVARAKEAAERISSTSQPKDNVQQKDQEVKKPLPFFKTNYKTHHSQSRSQHSPVKRHSSPSHSRPALSRPHSSPGRSRHHSPHHTYDARTDKHYSVNRNQSPSPSPHKNSARSSTGSRESRHCSPRGSGNNVRYSTHNDGNNSDYEPLRLRSFSPPPPDSMRKVKFIMPEEYYNRVKKSVISDSTVTGTRKLSQLYDRFEENLLNSESSELVNEDKDVKMKLPNDQEIQDDDGDQCGSDFESITGSEFSGKKSNDGVFSADEFDGSDESEDNEPDDGLSDISDDEGCHDNGLSAEEVRQRKLKDPKRLHKELWFNEKGETNEGPVCRCAAKEQLHGIRHAVYPGEKEMPMCDLLGNNGNKLHHYWVTVTPHANFVTDQPSTIHHSGRDFIFEGFSLFSHEPLEKVPSCSFIRFNIEYQIHFVAQPAPKNFCIRGIDLFSRFLFTNMLELFDWALKDDDKDECRRFHFMPRFVYKRKEQEKGFDVYELLSMDKVLSHLLESDKPLIQSTDLEIPANKRSEFAKSCRNQIVRKPGKKPAAFRIDDLDFSGCHDNSNTSVYPRVVHHGIRPVQMSYSGNPKYQKLWKSYIKLRNYIANRPVSSRKDHDRLVQLKVELEKIKLKSSMRRDFQIKLNSRGIMTTGIRSDMCQHAMLLPVLVHHIRYHMCLDSLDDKMGYAFKDRMLLQLALTHPSYHLNYGMNPDQARNSLSNCGVKQPRYGDRRIHLVHSRKKGITQLTRIMANLAKVEENSSMVRHNERLEFLGDAVIEFICSKHLFFMLPDKPEGDLAVFRSALVQNRHLAVLAKRLGLSDFMQFAHGPDLCVADDLNHAMANCLEALLGAVYLEAGLQVTTELFARLAFVEKDLYETWMILPKHQLQEQQPDGDRHLVKSSPVLQKLVKFEEASGIPFNHIRLLARAFTHPQVGFNNLTLGDNQRMEFLGDSVLQFVVSVYLYRYFPDHHEGHLTLLRSSLVNSRMQAEIARQLNLEEFMNFGAKGIKNIREKMLADVLEAFIAALFVDKGLKHVEVFCRVCFFSRLEDNIVNQEWMDSKSQLQQCCLALRVDGKTPDLPVYKVLQDAGPAHNKKYIVVVYYKGKRYGKGEGQSIQQAEMAAAKDALSSTYFPELARQKHLLDRKHKEKRTLPYSESSTRKSTTERVADRSRTTSPSPRRGSEIHRRVSRSPRRAPESSRRMSESSKRIIPSPRKGSPRISESSRKAADPHGLLDADDSWVDIDVSEISGSHETDRKYPDSPRRADKRGETSGEDNTPNGGHQNKKSRTE